MLTSLLPKPKFGSVHAPQFPTMSDLYKQGSSQGGKAAAPAFEPPPYGQRQNFTPRSIEDFGDGGAFPEIHSPQYPLNMGKKGGGGEVVPLQVDEQGNLQYDSIVRQGQRKDKVIYSQYKDLIPKDMDADALVRPSVEEEMKTAERTRLALNKLIDAKTAAARPHVAKQEKKEPVFIRYTPSSGSSSHNSGAGQRLIRLQEAQKDPMEPPKFRHMKIPAGAGSPPVPVVHSPPRKITVQDQQNWKIPPCISNWKNIKGYTIPLDKRLAADGRGLHETQVNSNFAKLSESLYHAEQNARKEIEARAKLQSKIARRRKQQKEEELRQLAAKARAQVQGAGASSRMEQDEEDIEQRDKREQLRKDRAREIRRDMRMEHMGQERKKAMKARREEERDISEQIALGKQPKMSKDAMYDQRLFNQSAGMDSGFGADDSYDTYDKPLFRGSSANAIYRPKAVDTDTYGGDEVKSLIEKSTTKFTADRGFKGAEKGAPPRDKPVAFEKDDADPYGMDEFLTKSRKSNALDKIGRRGGMAAAGGSSKGQEYSRKHDRSRHRDFEESSSSRKRHRH